MTSNRPIYIDHTKMLFYLLQAQFFIIFLQAVAFYSDTSCDQRSSKLLQYSGYFGVLQILVMIFLFINFYRKSYLNSRQSKLAPKDINKNDIKNK